jgi:hypothetical protein
VIRRTLLMIAVAIEKEFVEEKGSVRQDHDSPPR